jgi:hypothetical protein
MAVKQADVAQSVEQPPCKRQVTGSNPVVGSCSVESESNSGKIIWADTEVDKRG